MAYEHRRRRRYYYRKRWHSGRCVSEYIGAGPLAQLEARAQQIEQAQRAAERAERAHITALARVPSAAATYRTEIRRAVHAALAALGFHQHKRQWRKRMNDLATQRTAQQQRAMVLLHQAELSPAEWHEYRAALDALPQLARSHGDMFRQAKDSLLSSYADLPAARYAIDKQLHELAHDLGYNEATAMERLLIEDICLCRLDLYRIESAYGRSESTAIAVLQQFESLISAKHARYIRAIEALARVRRLLKLPAVQVNVAMDGGQQVNVQQ